MRTLIRGRGGDQWIKYLTTSKRGVELSKFMSQAKGGKDFDKPTGRIYTVAMLLDALKKSHEQAAAASAAKN